MTINPVEAFWVGINVVTAVLQLGAVLEARADWIALGQHDGSARAVVARGNIRRHSLRLAIQIALLSIAVPSLFRPGDTPLSLPLLVFLAVPVMLLANTVLDRRDRSILGHKLQDEIDLERTASAARIEARLRRIADHEPNGEAS